MCVTAAMLCEVVWSNFVSSFSRPCAAQTILFYWVTTEMLGCLEGSTPTVEQPRCWRLGMPLAAYDSWVRTLTGCCQQSDWLSSPSVSASCTASCLPISGWRPGRTMMLCSWDAEEYSLVGSVEFAEVGVQDGATCLHPSLSLALLTSLHHSFPTHTSLYLSLLSPHFYHHHPSPPLLPSPPPLTPSPHLLPSPLSLPSSPHHHHPC